MVIETTAVRTLGNYINGRSVDSQSGVTLRNINPANAEDILCEVQASRPGRSSDRLPHSAGRYAELLLSDGLKPHDQPPATLTSKTLSWLDRAASQALPELWERIHGLALKLTEAEIRHESETTPTRSGPV